MTGTNTKTSAQNTDFLQRAAEVATTSGLAVLWADRATPANTTSKRAPSSADTKTAILCSMGPPSGGSEGVSQVRRRTILDSSCLQCLLCQAVVGEQGRQVPSRPRFSSSFAACGETS